MGKLSALRWTIASPPKPSIPAEQQSAIRPDHSVAGEQNASTLVSVIVEQRAITTPWQCQAWQVTSVAVDDLGGPTRRVLRRDADGRSIRFSDVPMMLHARELTGYRLNFANGEPRLYVALNINEADGSDPVAVELVTASALELQARQRARSMIVQSAPMPLAIQTMIGAFLATVQSAAPWAPFGRI
jgi:hypothetical protein